MSTYQTTIEDLHAAKKVIRQFFTEMPLIRSYVLERELGLKDGRRVWLKDYGWTPVGSFKVMGAINWMHHHNDRIGNRPVVAHSSGNFASGLAYAGMRYGKRVIIVMHDTAARVKADLTRSFGAEIRTFDITTDHLTGARDALVKQLTGEEGGYAAHPYDDPFVIAGNGVGGLEIAESLIASNRSVSHFLCAVSGGGLMSGHALAIRDAFPQAAIIGVEPEGANDFQLSLAAGSRQRLEKPTSICDGLLSYDVGVHNWPILSQACTASVVVSDTETRRAMKWLYQRHGLRSEPSGAITLAALFNCQPNELKGDGDIVIVISGRNVDESLFADSLKSVD